MFGKLFFATLISTLALSAFSSESAGRYRVEGPGNSGGSGAQAGRYRSSDNSGSSNAVSNANQGSNSWDQVGIAQGPGRSRQGGSNFAPSTESFNGTSEYAHTMTQRAPAIDVSNKPIREETPRDSK